jgi:hypothetical protein
MNAPPTMSVQSKREPSFAVLGKSHPLISMHPSALVSVQTNRCIFREEERILNRALLLVDAPPQLQQLNADGPKHDNGHKNARATYQHGYYFARETQPHEHTQDEHTSPLPQEHYYEMLLKRYRAMRSSLSNYTINQGQSVLWKTDELPRNRHEWLYILNREYPTPAQISKLDDHNVARGLKYSAHGMERSDAISKQKSCWIWALLAKAGEVDTMLSEGISPIRELALKAGQLRMRFRDAESHRLETEYEAEDAESWEVDNIEPDYGGSEYSSDDDSELPNIEFELLEHDNKNHEEDSKLLTDGVKATEEVNDTMDISRKNEQGPKQEDSADSGADMSMSEDGEIQDDEPATLEEARARLFAQLGDRLVQPQANLIPQGQKGDRTLIHKPPGKVQTQSDTLPSTISAPSRGGRHKHNGKFCHDPSCAVEQRRRMSHQNTGLRIAQANGLQRERSASPREQPWPSRAVAEAQRQAMRKQELSHAEPKNGIEPRNAKTFLDGSKNTDGTNEASKPIQKVFASRAEAEDHRQAQRELESSHNPDVAPELANQGDVETGDVQIPDLNTRVTIDMILTIAAECYGQKDLLMYRDSWAK